MDNSPLGALPGELRNIIYSHVFDGSLEVCIDENGVADEAPKHALALRATCKEIRAETEGLARTVTTFMLKPTFIRATYGNVRLNVLFDLDAWLQGLGRYHFIDPQRVVLRVGELTVSKKAKVQVRTVWSQELQRIINYIPLEGLDRTDISFAIDLAISTPPVEAYHHIIELNNSSRVENILKYVGGMAASAKAHKRMISTAFVKEWELLTQAELGTRRHRLWSLAHEAQHVITTVLSEFFSQRERAKMGLSRSAAPGA